MRYIICDESGKNCCCELPISDHRAMEYFQPVGRSYYGYETAPGTVRCFDMLDGVLFGARWNAKSISDRYGIKARIFEYDPCMNKIGKEVI